PRQEHALAFGIGLDHEVPLSRCDALRHAAITASAALSDFEGLVRAPVGGALKPSENLKARERRSTAILGMNVQGGEAVGLALDVRIHFPIPRVLLVRRCD